MECLLDYKEEAQLCLDEIAYALKDGQLSSSLPSDSHCAFVNLTTREGLTVCVRLSSGGFRVSVKVTAHLCLHLITVGVRDNWQLRTGADVRRTGEEGGVYGGVQWAHLLVCCGAFKRPLSGESDSPNSHVHWWPESRHTCRSYPGSSQP